MNGFKCENCSFRGTEDQAKVHVMSNVTHELIQVWNYQE